MIRQSEETVFIVDFIFEGSFEFNLRFVVEDSFWIDLTLFAAAGVSFVCDLIVVVGLDVLEKGYR